MFLNNVTRVRLSAEIKEKMLKLMSIKQDKYDSESHLIRCAIMKLYNEEMKS